MESLQGTLLQSLLFLVRLLPLRESGEEHVLSGNHQELQNS